nr:PREDICTED: DNA-directed RNA polymerase III subunit RPC5-like [Haliaeetus albicilla]
MPEQAQGLPEQSYPFECGMGEELTLFQQFSLHGNDVFDAVIASCSQFPPQTAASPDELKVYALWEAGDTYDQHRQVLLEIFSKNYRVRRNVIQNQLSQECGEDLNKQEVDRVLKDCCVSYGGMWYLKGTVQS